MVELSKESKKTINELMWMKDQRGLIRKISLKAKRKAESEILLKASKIPHGEKCSRCEVNCEIKHKESVDFWAKREGLEPVYNLETCPKQGELQRHRIKMKKR